MGDVREDPVRGLLFAGIKCGDSSWRHAARRAVASGRALTALAGRSCGAEPGGCRRRCRAVPPGAAADRQQRDRRCPADGSDRRRGLEPGHHRQQGLRGGKFSTARPAGAAPGTRRVAAREPVDVQPQEWRAEDAFAPAAERPGQGARRLRRRQDLFVGGQFTKVGTAKRLRFAAFDVATGELLGLAPASTTRSTRSRSPATGVRRRLVHRVGTTGVRAWPRRASRPAS